MLTVKIPQYDFGYKEQFTIYTDGRQLTPKDLTDYKATLYVWDNTTDEATVIVQELTIANDPTTGIVYWDIQQGQTNNYGNYVAEIRLTQEVTSNDTTTIVLAFSTMQFNLQIIPTWQGIGA